MADQNSKTKTINFVNSILKEYLISKNFSEEDADNQVSVVRQALYKEIWDMNKKKIASDLEKEYQKKCYENEEQLKEEYKKKDNMNSFKKMTGLLFEGIFVAILVGLLVNQITDLISILKGSVNTYIKMPISMSTSIIIAIIIIILACLLGKYFVDKLKELYNEIYK